MSESQKPQNMFGFPDPIFNEQKDPFAANADNLFGFPNEAFKPAPHLPNEPSPVPLDHPAIKPEPFHDPLATKPNGDFGRRPHDETRLREPRLPRGFSPSYLRPTGPAITKDFLTEKEVFSFDPFGLTQPLTGRYDETRYRERQKGQFRRSRGGGLSHFKIPPCGKCGRKETTTEEIDNSKKEDSIRRGILKGLTQRQAETVAEVMFPGDQTVTKVHIDYCCGGTEAHEKYVRGEIQFADLGHCKCCDCWIAASDMVEHPFYSTNYEMICSCCYDHIISSTYECPNCHSRCKDDNWSKCDRCGTLKCAGCSDIRNMPSGWLAREAEPYDTVCHDCWKAIDLEHAQRREEKFGTLEEETASSESNKDDTATEDQQSENADQEFGELQTNEEDE